MTAHKKGTPVLVMNYLPANGEDKSSMVFASPDKVGSIAILGELQGLPADWVKKHLDYSERLTTMNDELFTAAMTFAKNGWDGLPTCTYQDFEKLVTVLRKVIKAREDA